MLINVIPKCIFHILMKLIFCWWFLLFTLALLTLDAIPSLPLSDIRLLPISDSYFNYFEESAIIDDFEDDNLLWYIDYNPKINAIGKLERTNEKHYSGDYSLKLSYTFEGQMYPNRLTGSVGAFLLFILIIPILTTVGLINTGVEIKMVR